MPPDAKFAPFLRIKMWQDRRAPSSPKRRKSLETQRFQGFSDGRGRRARTGPACGTRNGRCSLLLAPFRPLRQLLLAVSATGGARRRCPARGFGAAVGKRKNTSNSAVSRRLPQAKIVFDAVLMLLSFQLRKRSEFAPE